MKQLKKLWANLKQCQREAITKERQARLTTGGGPPERETTVDPDIANIAPHLMQTAPCAFSSNMSESCLNDKREAAYDLISMGQDTDELYADVLQCNGDNSCVDKNINSEPIDADNNGNLKNINNDRPSSS